MPSYPSILGNKYTNLSDLDLGRAPFPTPLTKQTRRPEIVQKVYGKYSHFSTSTCEQFLQDITIKNIHIEEEEAIQLTGISMIIYGSIQTNSVIAKPLLVATNELYFSKSTGRTEADVLADKVIPPKNLWGTPGTRQHDMHIYGGTNALYFLFMAIFSFFEIVILANPPQKTRQNMCLF